MANLRLLNIDVIDSTTIKARFTDELDSLIGISNINITANVLGVPDPEVLRVDVSKDILTIYTRPLTPHSAYFVEFKSTLLVPFKSKNGTSYLFEDGNTNVPMILGAEDPENTFRDTLINLLKDNVYSLDNGTLIRDIINSQSNNLQKLFNDIRQAKNDNYLSYTIHDEQKVRGAGPYDRLNEGGAYEIVRVGKNIEGSSLSGSISFTEFPNNPITLQADARNNERLSAGTGISQFNNLTLTVAYGPVTKVNSIVFAYSGGSTDTYNTNTYGYQLHNPRYDSDHASTMLTLEDNQIKLSETILETSVVLPGVLDEIIVSYEYKNLGKVISEASVAVSQVLDATREETPPIITQFTLTHSPIVTSTDVIATSGGVTFLDPSAVVPFSTIHPAFAKEIPFQFSGPPKRTGEYSVDYSTGKVFVYGVTIDNGTGDFPPVATYKYRKYFIKDLDYIYDPDTYELVASPLRDLAGEAVKVTFNYEYNFIPGIDYEPQVHIESIDERIDNRINATNSVSVENVPITNVFRVFNETSGEIYKVTRWSDSAIYFNYEIPPRIDEILRERASFTNVTNELLFVDSEFTNILTVRVFKILLENNRIISSTEDTIGSSYNTSVSFSRTDLFETELYFDGQVLTAAVNTDRLGVGDYQIDYTNGIVYVGVSVSQKADIGTINYKKSTILPQNPHIISVSEIYNSLSLIQGVNKLINYSSVSDSEIVPSSFDLTDERFLVVNGVDLPFVLDAGQIIVNDDIKTIRGIYDVYDLNNNNIPTNFADGATFSANVITPAVDGITKQETLLIGGGGVITATYISPGVEIVGVTSVLRLSDGYEMYDGSATFSGYDITVVAGTPLPGEAVNVIYNLGLNSSATPVVDYDRGEFFVDYTYLADEILVSYEYGDNLIDFRNSATIEDGNTYYVTYKVGALRDALLKNFGSAIEIPEVQNFDITLPRERYRDALIAALQSFTKGPTKSAISQMIEQITHIKPDIVEAAFDHWSLGSSYLSRNGMNYTGNPVLMPAKYDNGILLSHPEDTITFSVSNNISLEEGTLEMWVVPEWDGIDNDATLTFELYRDGYVMPSASVYIGSGSYNPTYDYNNRFMVNRSDEQTPIGLPSSIHTQTGMFVYYDSDVKRWQVLAKDSVLTDVEYSGTIYTSGEMYDVKFITDLGEINDVLRSRQNMVKFEFHIDGYDAASPDGYEAGDGYIAGYSFDGITFMSDNEHYLFDFGKTESSCRFSIFKDGKGYINFRVLDIRHPITDKITSYKVSADINTWLAGEKHHIATAWKLNSYNHRDEMHLFIDGAEVPNIIQYGGRPAAATTDRFRTVVPEIIAGTIPLNIVQGTDLVTVMGSDIVYSTTTDFTAAGIGVGDTIHIIESGFSTYTTLSVTGNIMQLNAFMPATLSDVKYVVNEFGSVVATNLNLYSNLAVSLIRGAIEIELPGLRATEPGYVISKNLLNQNVITIYGPALSGDEVAIRTLGINHRRFRDRKYMWSLDGYTSVLKTQLPPPISLDEVNIYPVPLPLVSIGPSNAALILGRFFATGLSATQPSSPLEGRTLAVRMTGGNVSYAVPPTVTINGTAAGVPTSEVLTFTAPAIINTVAKFQTITSIDCEATPIITTRNSVAIEVKEAYSMTYPDGNTIYPVIRFSYQTQNGATLEGTGTTTVTDNTKYFPLSAIGQIMVITSPIGVAGTYTVTGWTDTHNITVTPAPPIAFSGATYTLYDVTMARSGFDNGFFTFEIVGTAGIPFMLNHGFYDIDYCTYLEIAFDPVSMRAYVGSDMTGSKQANAIIDELRILSTMLTDVRAGETLATGEKSVTVDATSIHALHKDSDTLMLAHFDELPLINDSDYWVNSEKRYIQSSSSVNSEFGHSLVVSSTPVVVENSGKLYTYSEGTIEFWVSPKFDTYNDPKVRTYFDACGAAVENTTSITKDFVKTTNAISKVNSIRLITDTDNNGINYYTGGFISSDFKTIKLGTQLPSQQTPVKIDYIRTGLLGDRITIYKDTDGALNFNVHANGVDYQAKQAIFWAADTWHRIMATYKFNRSDNLDEIRLFVDGEERGGILFGSGLLFGSGFVFGQGFAGPNNAYVIDDINFYDPINEFFIGSNYLYGDTANARIDNLKISNISRPPLTIGSQPKDVNYSSNTATVLPVVTDVYTTYLQNFDTMISKAEDFAVLRDEVYGIFNFILNIIDSFDIVSSSAKVQQILEALIKALKPAHAKAEINYIA